jgi:hypothetical protein
MKQSTRIIRTKDPAPPQVLFEEQWGGIVCSWIGREALFLCVLVFIGIFLFVGFEA